MKLVLAIICFLIGGLRLVTRNRNSKKELNENYIQTKAAITFIGSTRKGMNTKAYLGVNYYYENKKHMEYITKTYKKNEYYGKKDEIIIYINKNNVNKIQ